MIKWSYNTYYFSFIWYKQSWYYYRRLGNIVIVVYYMSIFCANFNFNHNLKLQNAPHPQALLWEVIFLVSAKKLFKNIIHGFIMKMNTRAPGAPVCYADKTGPVRWKQCLSTKSYHTSYLEIRIKTITTIDTKGNKSRNWLCMKVDFMRIPENHRTCCSEWVAKDVVKEI